MFLWVSYTKAVLLPYALLSPLQQLAQFCQKILQRSHNSLYMAILIISLLELALL